MAVIDIYSLIKAERKRQIKKWGIQDHAPLKWLAILGEEVGETNKAVLEDDLENYAEELIQVAAVAVAALETLLWKQSRNDLVLP